MHTHRLVCVTDRSIKLDRQRLLDMQLTRELDELGSRILDRIADCRDPRVGPHENCTCANDIEWLQQIEQLRSCIWPQNRAR